MGLVSRLIKSLFLKRIEFRVVSVSDSQQYAIGRASQKDMLKPRHRMMRRCRDELCRLHLWSGGQELSGLC